MEPYLDDIRPDTEGGMLRLRQFEDLSEELNDAKRAVKELEDRMPRIRLTE